MALKIKVQVSTGWANGEHTDYWDLPDDWKGLSQEEKDQVLNDYAEEYLYEKCDSYAEVVEEDEDEA